MNNNITISLANETLLFGQVHVSKVLVKFEEVYLVRIQGD